MTIKVGDRVNSWGDIGVVKYVGKKRAFVELEDGTEVGRRLVNLLPVEPPVPEVGDVVEWRVLDSEPWRKALVVYGGADGLQPEVVDFALLPEDYGKRWRLP